jgi:hypothetical protein
VRVVSDLFCLIICRINSHKIPTILQNTQFTIYCTYIGYIQLHKIISNSELDLKNNFFYEYGIIHISHYS